MSVHGVCVSVLVCVCFAPMTAWLSQYYTNGVDHMLVPQEAVLCVPP